MGTYTTPAALIIDQVLTKAAKEPDVTRDV
jgi:hypothetical protein